MGHMLVPLSLYSLTGKVTSKDLIRLTSAWHRSTGISSCHPSSRWQELFVVTQPRDGIVWNNLNKYTSFSFFPLTPLHTLSQLRTFQYCLMSKRLIDCWVEIGLSLVARWPAGPLIRQIGGGSGRSGDEELLTGAWTVLTLQRFGWQWWRQITDRFFLTAAATTNQYRTFFMCWLHMRICSVSVYCSSPVEFFTGKNGRSIQAPRWRS